VIIFPVRQVTFASSNLSLSAEKKILSFSLTQRVMKFFETSDFLKLDGRQKLSVRREDSAGVLFLVVPDGMIFPNGDAKNYTSVPVSSF
jgi:hypothetical protein